MIAAGQHRLERIQLVNWGTFNGAFDLPVPREGLLVTGPSGSGKSSLLDAMASVLVQPRWLSFNAAAQEGGAPDRHRSMVSYVRGAYKREVDDATGEVATAYLRADTTWSGVALTFHDGAGTRTGLVRLLHLPRGTNSADALGSVFVLADEDADLLSLSPYVENGINTRQLRAAHSSWSTHPTYSSFAAKLQRRLGLASDQAQRLLHKTQSAKNLTSLDTLLRDFMLDEPDTFSLVDQSVAQFQELSLAHQSVVDARRQVELLRSLRGIDAELAGHRRRADELEQEETHLRTVVLELAVASTAERVRELGKRVAALDHELVEADDEVTACESLRDAARAAVDGLGGRELRELDAAIAASSSLLQERTRKRLAWGTRCGEVGLELPTSEAGFTGFRTKAEALRGSLLESDESRQERFQLIDQAARARRRVTSLEGQLHALTRQQSNLDERLLDIRRKLLESSGAARDRLPFAGELLDVRPDDAAWRGAMERVLRSFARTLLVPDDLYPHVSEFVERTHLGTRLVYERIPARQFEPRPVDDPRSLADKLVVADSEFSGWVSDELHRRFDYTCVDSVAELRAVVRGVTVAGQVKHSATRHEKDDRSRIDDRTAWVLGTSTQAKQAALEEALSRDSEVLHLAEETRDAAESSRDERARRAALLDQLLALTWDDVDVITPERKIDRLTGRAQALRASSGDLPEAERQLTAATARLSAARVQRDRIFARVETTSAKRAELEDQLTRWQGDLATAAVPPGPTREALARRLSAAGVAADQAEAQARQRIGEEQRDVVKRSSRAAGRAERIMQAYKADWPLQGQDWGIQVDYLPDFLGRLDALEADRLPEFEQRFFTLLQTQSQNNIGILSTRLRSARREVRERVDPINASLRLTDYAPGHHLHVRVDDRRLPEVTEFLQSLTEIVGGSLAEVMGPERDDEARDQAEARFVRMQALLTRLASAEPSDQRWRQLCLDTRQHVKFVAEVRDAGGRPVDFFTGAGGLSGGERQKLVVFCLAAALRYQLARGGAERPAYGLVVLDEAFDKTDPAFTKAGLDVFRQFGFQLLLATPLKMLQTLEDYVGGAAVVLNESGSGSRLEYLAFAGQAAGPASPARPDDVQAALV